MKATQARPRPVVTQTPVRPKGGTEGPGVLLSVLNKELAAQLANVLGQAEFTVWSRDGASPHASMPAGRAPAIVVLDDPSPPDRLHSQVASLRSSYEQAAIFVISADSRPESIVEVMKAGATEIFFPPFDVQKFLSAIDKACRSASAEPHLPQGQVYSFISSKGGLGTSVLAVNTATALAAHEQKSVALVDLSLQSGDLSALVDIAPHSTIGDLCSNFHRLDPALLKGAMTRHTSGFQFLPAPKDMDDSSLIEPHQIARILALSRSLYANIVVDCTSMTINECTLEALRASNRIFIVTDLSVPALRNAGRLVESMHHKGLDDNCVEIVINRFIKNNSVPLEEIEGTLKKQIFWLFPNDFDASIAAINRGVPVISHQPKTALAKNVVEFAQKLVNPLEFQNYRGVRALWGKNI